MQCCTHGVVLVGCHCSEFRHWDGEAGHELLALRQHFVHVQDGDVLVQTVELHVNCVLGPAHALCDALLEKSKKRDLCWTSFEIKYIPLSPGVHVSVDL